MNYLKQFEYIITVTEADGISHAAEKLQIAQPTLSKYVQKIERSLGTELFDRSTLPIRLTRAGECYVEMGQQMIALDRQMHKRLEEIISCRDMEIRVGISPSRSPYLLPPIVKAFCQACPGSRVLVEEGVTGELNEKLTSGRLDLIISLLDESTERFDRVELFEETIVLAVHRNRAQGRTPPEIIREAPLIALGKGQSIRETVATAVPELADKTPVIESQNLESSMAFVRADIGVSLVPSYIAAYGSNEINHDVLFLPVEAQDGELRRITRKVCLFHRKAQFLTSAEKALMACAIQAIHPKTTGGAQ